jgi:iron(III) transport system ATP-binding protein
VTGFDLAGVHKSFRSQPVLRGVDLAIETGSLTAILGASGSGKTTLLRLLAGFERVDSGVITVGGRVVDDGRRHVAPERRRVGYVPQEGALFPHLTVAGNVGFGLDRAARHGRGRVDELLELVGLAGLGRRYPHQLSGGQQQRVALARALAIRPSLVLLDEPFASLDAALRTSVRADVVRVLRTAGTTALLVTHDQDEALSAADRVAVLRDGVIAQVGTPRELYERPKDLDLARFVGEANVFDGVAEDGGARTALGTVALHGDRRPGGAGEHVLVLVRPEQIQVTSARGDAPAAGGVVGDVQQIDYFGHDTVVTVRPLDGDKVIRVRLTGSDPIPTSGRVRVTAHGPVCAWPAAGPS